MKISSNILPQHFNVQESSPISKGEASADRSGRENLVVSESQTFGAIEAGPLDFDERAALDRDDPMGRLVAGAFTLEARPFGELNLI